VVALLDGIIHHHQDHVLFVDVGLADQVVSRVISLGKNFEPVTRDRSSINFASPREQSGDGEIPGSARGLKFFKNQEVVFTKRWFVVVVLFPVQAEAQVSQTGRKM
jgi:hypothetical protein